MRILRICLIFCLALAAPAAAQEPGVFIDPDAPSAKEYELPFESARRQADPQQGPSAPIAPGSRESPTFGEGITRGNAPGSGGSRESEQQRAEEKQRPSREIASSDGDAAVIRAATTNPGAPSGGASVLLPIAGIGLGVLLVGGVAGLLWRRRA